MAMDKTNITGAIGRATPRFDPFITNVPAEQSMEAEREYIQAKKAQTTEEILAERGKEYGSFSGHAELTSHSRCSKMARTCLWISAVLCTPTHT